FYFFFFFSSRRRHTRWPRDWSSDVCSSDLVVVRTAANSPRGVAGVVLLDGDALPGGGGAAWLSHLLVPPWYTSVYRIATDWDWRSEERRVGKGRGVLRTLVPDMHTG